MQSSSPSSPASGALHAQAPAGLSTPVLLLMATACGLCAGANYFNQPLLHSIAVQLGVSESRAAFTVTISQVSYAAGLLLLVPLGDKLERRRLVVALMALAACGLFLSGFAGSFGALAAGTLITGLFSVAAQVLVPMAAALASPGRSGRAVGLVMSGLLVGILAARSVAGLLSGVGGWSLVYRAGGVAMLAVALALWFVLPALRTPHPPSYAQVLRSLATLARQHPRLRSRALLGGLSFGSVSVLFSTMALMLAGPSHQLGDAQIGLVGLAGVAGALMANWAGRMADRGHEQGTTRASVLLVLASWGALWLGGTSLPWFLAGVLAIDLALQGVHISNQNVIYALAPQARSRLNAVYMTTYFAGAALGSALGSAAWQHGGWDATCAAGLAMAGANCAAMWHDARLARQAPRRA
ncbi:MFS transporter [Paracidovorax citrulli]|uniref:Major facilitator superfamily MFS_1 n=2 Tax=Paracidovorax citrulli TaxID=80869 RepID=A1TPG4_PARC0|nr:major facilitator superfamily MFS_1 [Paracidovorax citrulli AAC00-1]ATG93165.1 MFS transporter [Paracidovorax citrulli]PVY67069.1 putative MFS family arabinose efflux permease [Paracidovorax citrulli]QCX12916.1 putative transporter [Paracidovorax citrulli]REG68768.1 putative MFS family arabinose efflux permease [Paracidovorax citrulli]